MTILLEENAVSVAKKKLFVSGLEKMVGLGGLEPPTSPLSGVRSNQAELQTQKIGKSDYKLNNQLGKLSCQLI